MNVKVTAHFGKKIPIDGVEFSSQHYDATIEIDASERDLGHLGPKLAGLWAELRDAVEHEINGNGNGNGHAPELQSARARGFIKPRTAPRQSQEGPWPISNGQRSSIEIECKQRKISNGELVDLLTDRFGKTALGDLTWKEASSLLDEMGVPRKKKDAGASTPV